MVSSAIGGANAVKGRKAAEVHEINRERHTDAIWSVYIDGDYILTASRDNTARCWDTQTGRCVRCFLGHTAQVYQAIVAHKRRVVTASSEYVNPYPGHRRFPFLTVFAVACFVVGYV